MANKQKSNLLRDEAIEDLDPELRHDLERLERLVGPIDPLDDHSNGGELSPDAVRADEEDSVGDNVDLFDPSFFGVDAADWPVDVVDDEKGDGSSLALASKLNNAAKHYLPLARKREGKQALKKITIDDFDTQEEKVAFLIIEKYKVDLFGHKAKPKGKLAAVEWFFCNSRDEKGVTFDICAEVLESRTEVVRLRIHYEFWLRWMVFSQEFPFMTVPIPSLIRAEIMYHSNMFGLEVANEAWLQPGLPTELLLTRAAAVDSIGEVPTAYREALDLLESRYLISPQHNGWYLTGRNPLLQRLDLEKTLGRNRAGGTVHWSRLFYKPHT